MNSLKSHLSATPLKFSSPKLHSLATSVTSIQFPRAASNRTGTAKRSSKPSKTLSPTTPTSLTTKINDPGTAAPPPPLKKVLVPVGFGTEDMEAVIIIDVLRRAGANVTVASVESQLEVQTSAGTRLVADTSILSCADKTYDLVALPGGMPGSARLRDCEILQKITSKQSEEKRLFGAISAAPAVTLQPWGLLRRKRTTCHPAFAHKLPTFWAVKSNIQVSGELTTSRGPGTSFEFALTLVEHLYGESFAEELRKSLLIFSADDDPKKEEYNNVEWFVDCTPSVLLPVANGSEEIEVATLVDILHRAKMNVVVASVEKSVHIVASEGIKIVADKLIGDAGESTYDLIILPGGIDGSERLQKSKILKKLLKEQYSAGRIYGAVGSSPVVLEKQGLLKDKKATAHPSVISKLTNEVIDGSNVVIDGKVITSWGLAAMTDFCLAVVSKVFGHARARSVAEGLVFEYSKS